MLIVDDEPALTATLSRTVETLGYEVEVVNDPTIAITACESVKPDVLLLDMIMPHNDGISVLDQILSRSMVPHVILMSGLSEGYLRIAQNLAKIHGNCAVSILKKPFRRSDIAKLLTGVAQ